jgi:GNAT superfamily N-acetyltransferase
MAISYRKATTDDIPELVRLRIDFLNDPSRKPLPAEQNAILRVSCADYFNAGLLDGSLVVFVAEADNGEIIATSALMFWRHIPGPVTLDGRKAVIANMYTIPEYRGKGIATQLMRLQMQEAKTRGVNAINLSATAMGRTVYEKLGFVPDGDEMKIKLT